MVWLEKHGLWRCLLIRSSSCKWSLWIFVVQFWDHCISFSWVLALVLTRWSSGRAPFFHTPVWWKWMSVPLYLWVSTSVFIWKSSSYLDYICSLNTFRFSCHYSFYSNVLFKWSYRCRLSDVHNNPYLLVFVSQNIFFSSNQVPIDISSRNLILWESVLSLWILNLFLNVFIYNRAK